MAGSVGQRARVNAETNSRWNHQRSWPVAEVLSRTMCGRDPYTVAHQRRVARLARDLRELSLPKRPS